MYRIIVFILILSSTAFAGDIHCKHFFQGMPLGAPDENDLIIRDCYALSNNSETNFADWVAYKITPREITPLLDLHRKWRADPWLSDDETLEPTPSSKDDYKGVGGVRIDRGHLAPLASFKGSIYASQVNYYSNITPQKADLNQGAWLDLENRVRELVKEHDTVWVITGPLYEYESEEVKEYLPSPTEDDGKVLIPSHFWKVVCIQPSKSESSIQIAGFIFDQNTDRNSPITNHTVAIDEIEKRSGLDFLSQLSEEKQNELESEIMAEWVTEE